MTKEVSKTWKSEKFGVEKKGFSNLNSFLHDDETYKVEVDMGNQPPREGYVIGETDAIYGVNGEKLTENYLLVFFRFLGNVSGIHRSRIRRR